MWGLAHNFSHNCGQLFTSPNIRALKATIFPSSEITRNERVVSFPLSFSHTRQVLATASRERGNMNANTNTCRQSSCNLQSHLHRQLFALEQENARWLRAAKDCLDNYSPVKFQKIPPTPDEVRITAVFIHLTGAARDPDQLARSTSFSHASLCCYRERTNERACAGRGF